MPALIALAAALVLAGCSRGAPPSPAECAQLLDHYVDALLRADGHTPTHPERERALTLAHERARTNPAFQRCPREVSRESVECAARASSADEIERCLIVVP